MKRNEKMNSEKLSKGTGKKWVRSVALLLVAVLAVTWVFPSLVKIVNGTAEENDPIARIYSILTGTLSDPQSAEEYAELANIAIAQESYDAALGYLATARTLVEAQDGTQMSELWLKSASIYVLEGDMGNAQVCLDSALRLNPESAQALLLQAQMRIEALDYAGAAAELKKYVALSPEDKSTWQTLAQLYESMGDYEAAELEYREMYTMYADDAHLLNALRCGFLGGDYEASMNAFDEYLTEHPEADAQYRGVAAFLKAACLMQLGRYAEAAEGFGAAIDEGYDAATCYEQMVACRFEGGEYESTVLAGEEMLAKALTPAAADAFYQRMGVSLMQIERYEEAVDYLGRSIEANGALAGNRYYRGVSYLALDRMDEAIADFSASIDEEYMVQYCYYNRGVCYLQKLDYDSALDDFEMTLTSGTDQSLIQGAKDVLWQLVEYYENQAAAEQNVVAADIPYDEAVE